MTSEIALEKFKEVRIIAGRKNIISLNFFPHPPFFFPRPTTRNSHGDYSGLIEATPSMRFVISRERINWEGDAGGCI